MRRIDVEKLKEAIQKNICEMSCDEPRGCSCCKASDVWDVICEQPTVDAEPTEEQVREYCRKRCLTLVTDELFDEMQARWSNEPVRHGWWVIEQDGTVMHCDYCGWAFEYNAGLEEEWNYCPHCGAKADKEAEWQDTTRGERQ